MGRLHGWIRGFGIEFFLNLLRAFDRKNFFSARFSLERVKHLPIEKFSTIIDNLFYILRYIYTPTLS